MNLHNLVFYSKWIYFKIQSWSNGLNWIIVWSSTAASTLSLLSTLWLAQDNKTGMCEKNYSINPHLQDKTKLPFVGTRWQFLLDKIVQRNRTLFSQNLAKLISHTAKRPKLVSSSSFRVHAPAHTVLMLHLSCGEKCTLQRRTNCSSTQELTHLRKQISVTFCGSQ